MKHLLILNGSVKKNGTSKSVINSISSEFISKGIEIRETDLIDVFDQRVSKQQLLQAMQQAESIIIVTSCYVNTLPYPTIKCLEGLVEMGGKSLQGKPLYTIAHGGMPYLDVHEHCLLVCKCFAEAMGMDYKGGAIRGLTPLINGKPLESCGFMGKRFIKGLKLFVEDVIQESAVSPKVQKILKNHMPSFLNGLIVAVFNYGVKKDREAHGVVDFDRQVY